MSQPASLQKKAAHASHTFTPVRTPGLAFSSVSMYLSPLSSQQLLLFILQHFTQMSTVPNVALVSTPENGALSQGTQGVLD